MNDQPEKDTPSVDGSKRYSALNLLLILASVVAFGMIIFDRVDNMMAADDVPEFVALPADAQLHTVQTAAAPAAPSNEDETIAVPSSEIETVFGTRLVFVSQAEPAYVVTEDERRIGVGEAIDEQTTLAGIARGRVIVERSGNLQALQLPEPRVQ